MLSKNTPILIIGFGSIGRRHWRNLRTLGFKNITVCEPEPIAGTEFKGVRIAKNLTSSLARQHRLALICSPNHLHLKQALLCARSGCHLFIEKPLSHTLSGLSALERVCKKKKLAVQIGYNWRFHPVFIFIKDYLKKKKLGRVYRLQFEAGYYLPYWRPQQDYRKNYAAKKATGGGIALDGSHEFDLLFWLNDFSPVKRCELIRHHSSNLAIETEDQAIGVFLFQNSVLGAVSSDYLQRSYTRSCEVVGEKGTLRWSFETQAVKLFTERGSHEIFSAKRFDINQTYLDELSHFIKNCARARPASDYLAQSRQLLSCIIK